MARKSKKQVVSYIEIDKLKVAYRKLKHYFYYDNMNLFCRKAIAEFEASPDFFERLEKLKYSIDYFCTNLKSDNHLQELLELIDYKVLPKKIKTLSNKDKTVSEGIFYTNTSFKNEITIDKITYFIEAPVEVYIISVLWIMKEGYLLEGKNVKHQYGNRLQMNRSRTSVADGLNLFMPYFVNYQKWRDNAINTAKELLTKGTNVAIVGLDIKSYYDSVELDFSKMEKRIVAAKGDQEGVAAPFTQLLELVHQSYFSKRKGNLNGLPIGLLSSSVISNWYLSGFDNQVNKELRPIYYGRYVDDILIVLSNPSHNNEKGNKFSESFFNKYFIDNDILIRNQKGEFQLTDNNLCIQKEKISLMYFQANEPITLLNQFQEELRKNSSEFRFLPSDKNDSFDGAAHSVNYSGSKLKFRSITDFTSDKFGASKYLANKIYAATQIDYVRDGATIKQLITYFKNERILEFHTLWEKLFTYFILVGNHKAIYQFLNNLDRSLNELKSSEDLEDELEDIKYSLQDYLHTALSMAVALTGKALDSPSAYHSIGGVFENGIETFYLAKALRKSNMVRHRYVFNALLNFTEVATEDDINLIDKNTFYLTTNKKVSFSISENTFKFSPRFVHFHEVTNFLINKKLHEFDPFISIDSNHQERPVKADIRCDVFENYLVEAFDLFYQLNYNRSGKQINKEDETYIALRAEYLSGYEQDAPHLSKNKEVEVSLSEMTLMKDKKKHSLKIGLANMKVYQENIKESYLKKPIVTPARREEINYLLNQVTEEGYESKVDILVFPEVSIPFKWMNWMADHARKNQLAIVFGLEHWVVNDIAYNLNVILLPIVVNTTQSDGSKVKMKAVVPIIRVKNHYSPGEVKDLKGYRYNIPIPTPQRYDLISWKGVSFACFNCFELANLSHRSLFRSRVDFLIACEFNRDTNYFSNIVEAVTRDVHCYFIQSNNSEYGDNRITKPSKTAVKDIIKIKGGENSTILVSTIDIKKLREFQKKEHNLQMDDSSFKLTPPGFNVYEKRLGLKKDK